MVSHMKISKDKNIAYKIDTPTSLDELRKEVDSLIKTDDGIYRLSNSLSESINTKKKQRFFSKIKTFLKK